MAEVLDQNSVARELADHFDDECLKRGVEDPNVLTVEARESAVLDDKVVISANVDPGNQEQVKVAGALVRAFLMSGQVAEGQVTILPPQRDTPEGGFMAYVDKAAYPQLRQTVPVRSIGAIPLQNVTGNR